MIKPVSAPALHFTILSIQHPIPTKALENEELCEMSGASEVWIPAERRDQGGLKAAAVLFCNDRFCSPSPSPLHGIQLWYDGL